MPKKPRRMPAELTAAARGKRVPRKVPARKKVPQVPATHIVLASSPDLNAVKDRVYPLCADYPVWERQPGEKDAAWASFLLFRGMPPADRSMQAHSKLAGGARAARYHYQWQWTERVAHWDRDQDRIVVAARAVELALQAAKDVRTERTVQDLTSAIVVRTLRSYAVMLGLDPDTLEPVPGFDESAAPALTIDDARKLAEFFMKTSRGTRGEATQVTEHRVVHTMADRMKQAIADGE